MFHSARRNGKSEAICQAAELAHRMGCDMVAIQLACMESVDRLKKKTAIDVEFRVVEEPKQLTNCEDNG